MHIYLKKDGLIGKITPPTTKGALSTFMGTKLFYSESNPYIDLVGPVDTMIKNMEEMDDVFLKATEYVFPKYSAKRELGIYKFGKATGELTFGQNSPYWLLLSTDQWEGIIDMEILKVKIATGKIAPTISYERVQIKKNVVSVFITTLNELFKDAIAYIKDPDARIVSNFTYPNGNPMSLRDAKKNNLI
jgi:hypothetical protein